MNIFDLINFIRNERNKSKRPVFQLFDGLELKVFLTWADTFKYLFVNFNDKKQVDGVLITYPINEEYKGDADMCFKYSKIVPFNEEFKHEYFVAEILATNHQARVCLIKSALIRFPELKTNNVWSTQYGRVKKLPNKLITNLTK